MNNKNEKFGFDIYKRPYINSSLPIINIVLRIIIVAVMAVCCVSIAMTTLNINFDFSMVIKCAVITAVVCSLMYFNIILTFAIPIGFIVFVSGYIIENKDSLKLGIISMINIGYEVVRSSFNLPYANGFNVVTGMDCSDEIQIIVLLCTIALTILLSFFVGRYMSVIFSALIVYMTVSYCFFLENVKDYNSVIILLSMYLLIIYIKFSGSGKLIISKKFRKNGKMSISIKSNGGIMSQTAAGVAVIATTVVFVTCTAFSRGFYDKSIGTMSANNFIKYTIRDVMVLKYAEYKKYVVPAEVNQGQLGFYSVVKPEFDTLFTIITKPISDDKLYLKSFTGAEYKYRGNFWDEKTDISDINITDATANSLKESGNTGEIKFNSYIGGFSSFILIPYYTVIGDNSIYNYVNDCITNGTTEDSYEITVYKGDNVTIDDSVYRQQIYDEYTLIDDKNRVVIENILKNANINNSTADIDYAIKKYLSDNYTYDFDNGIVPFGDDFVNSFLTETKKGNFAHFASAATLMYRSLGIPARYAGGYTVDKEQILSNRIRKDGNFKVNVRNANMYAWVEVYKDGFGWQPVDVSPSPSFAELAEKYDTEDGDKQTVSLEDKNVLDEYFKPIENEYYNPMHFGKNIVKILIHILIIVLLIISVLVFGKIIIKEAMWHIKYNRGNNSLRAYMLMERLRIKFKLSNSCDYTDFSKAAAQRGFNLKQCNELMELANKLVFSNKLEDKDLQRLRDIIKHIK